MITHYFPLLSSLLGASVLFWKGPNRGGRALPAIQGIFLCKSSSMKISGKKDAAKSTCEGAPARKDPLISFPLTFLLTVCALCQCSNDRFRTAGGRVIAFPQSARHRIPGGGDSGFWNL